MDYKYIEQLLERYFQCETTLKEEEILRAFFTQADVPVWLMPYQQLFCQMQQREEPLTEAFDERILELIEQQGSPVKARTITLTQRLMPLFKAAAIVAIVLTLGNAAQAPWDRGWDNTQERYADNSTADKDSLGIQAPVQAEILPVQNDLPDDSSKAKTPLVPATY